MRTINTRLFNAACVLTCKCRVHITWAVFAQKTHSRARSYELRGLCNKMDNIKKIELWPYQTELEQLVRENPRVLAVWGSLTGKTFMSIKVCADHLFDHPNSTVLLVSPIIPTQSTLIYVQSVTQEAMRLKPW